MTDVFDQAQQLEELQRDIALAEQAKRIVGNGREDCIACGEPISEERRAAMPSAIRCFECQGRRERWDRRKGR